MKIAIAGTSGHIHYILDALSVDPTLSVAAVSPGAPGEPIAQLLSTLDRMGQWPQVFESAEDMMRTPGLDIAVAAAPFYRNADIALEAFKRELAVFSEKPLALNLDRLRELEKEQRRSGRPLCAMLGTRNEPHFATAKRALDADAVGTIALVTGQKSYKLGARPAFYTARETYGGTIPWVAIHAIDWCTWLTGLRFTDVTARHTTLGNDSLGDLESAATMLFTLESGAMATVNADYLRPPTAYTHGDDRMRVAGINGVLEVRAGHVYYTPKNKFQSEMELKPVLGIFEAFAGFLRGECENPVPTQDGIYATAAALIARESADTGRTICFSEYGW